MTALLAAGRTARWTALPAAVLLLAVVALTQRAPSADGVEGPRIPDLWGVVEAVGEDGLRLAGGEVVSTVDVEVRSAYDLQPVPPRPGLFVHVGLEAGAPEWITVLGVVAQFDEPHVAYTAFVEEIRDDRLFFVDGTVVPAGGLQALPGYAIVRIDPETGVAVSVHQNRIDHSD